MEAIKMQVRPWPFAAEELVEAYWYCSTRQMSTGSQLFEVVFSSLEQDRKEIINLAWGSLPYIRLGRVYQDGYLIDKEARGEERSLWKMNIANGEMVSAAQLPKSLWQLDSNPFMCRQKLWRCQHHGKNVYIPCTELIRCFFGTTTFMANLMLSHHSLEKVVEEKAREDETCHYKFNTMIPKAVITDHLAIQIAWILEHDQVHKEWGRLAKLATLAKGRNESWIVPEFEPFSEEIDLECRCVSDQKNILVLEIGKVERLEFEFNNFSFFHPSFVRLNNQGENADEPRRKRKTQTGETQPDKRYATGDEGMPSFGNGYAAQAAPATFISLPIGFHTVRVKETKDGKKKRTEQEETIERKRKVFSTQDSKAGGNLIPLEIVGVEMLDNENKLGLMEFIDAIKMIAYENISWKVSLEFQQMPEHTKLSTLPSGQPRCYAVAKVETSERQVVISEISRPDKWQIATLIVKDGEFDDDIKGYISEAGHWKKDGLLKSSRKVTLVRHTSVFADKRLARVVSKEFG